MRKVVTAFANFILNNKFSLIAITFLSWFGGLLFIWLEKWNLAVLPVWVFWHVVPRCFLETIQAVLII